MALPNIATYSEYGGEKQDYSAVEDPTTDRSAAEMNGAFSDLAGMTRMIPRAMVEFDVNEVVLDHDSVWGNDVSIKPVVLRIGNGEFTVTWPTTVTDARGEDHALNLRRGSANAEDGGTGFCASTTRQSPNVFRVATLTVPGSNYEDPPGKVQLYVW